MKKYLIFLTTIFFMNLAFANLTTKEIALPNQLKLVKKTKVEKQADPKSTVKIIYPQITGKDLNANAEKFNQAITKIVNDRFESYKKTIQDSLDDNKNLPKEVNQYSLFITYQADAFKAGEQFIITVRLNTETSFAGAAHPSRKLDVYNYNLTTGEELTLSQLFEPNSNYLNVISDYVKKGLNKKLGTRDSTFDDGAEPKLDNFKNWNLLPNGILITFDEYQVAAYVFGQPEVLVPYSVLKNDFAVDAPIKNNS